MAKVLIKEAFRADEGFMSPAEKLHLLLRMAVAEFFVQLGLPLALSLDEVKQTEVLPELVQRLALEGLVVKGTLYASGSQK